jgi:hypothetical protein
VRRSHGPWRSTSDAEPQRTLDRARDRLETMEEGEGSTERQTRILELRESYAELGDLLELSREYSVTEIIESLGQYD